MFCAVTAVLDVSTFFEEARKKKSVALLNKPIISHRNIYPRKTFVALQALMLHESSLTINDNVFFMNSIRLKRHLLNLV